MSQCLVGDEVRYDGSGARSSVPYQKLAELFDFHTICPEVGIGMSIPREPIRLVGTLDDNRVVGVKDPSIDKTADLEAFAAAQVDTVGQLDGYVFMHNSPSCGLFHVKVYPSGLNAPAVRQGRGAYARALMDALPLLPVEEGGRLFDDVLCENFVTRVYAYAHWRRAVPDMTPGGLIAFHSAYKFLLMAHSPRIYGEVGRLLSNLKHDFEDKRDAYIGLLLEGLSQPATRKTHANVLSHLQGYLKKRISSAERQELDEMIQAYRRAELPLLAPMAVLRHHFRRHPDDYVLGQSYLDPHPSWAGLRRTL
ncbi:MAG: DUF523 and DUF1722 domain-containing protein [Pseudomonadota bacterium]